MKHVLKLVLFVAISLGFVCTAVAAEVTEADVVSLVEKTAGDMAADAPGTIAKVIGGEHPYKNKDNPSSYVFVYNGDVQLVAHPKKQLVGRSYKGKPDVRGKKFRDEIVAGGMSSGTGWVDYSYKKPGTKGIHEKTTYFKAVKGSDGVDYVVCSGKYK